MTGSASGSESGEKSVYEKTPWATGPARAERRPSQQATGHCDHSAARRPHPNEDGVAAGSDGRKRYGTDGHRPPLDCRAGRRGPGPRASRAPAAPPRHGRRGPAAATSDRARRACALGALSVGLVGRLAAWLRSADDAAVAPPREAPKKERARSDISRN
ncbi:unnamed protein product [Prorocentrum cordatum]|uniref:Uncharacterized protein n=1 Tax=Prorocentrum cordatum TaxID=2364126 RepID=A0ABN9QP26_9DINO|nr:unnamed protein product [Polarella glacialis]